MNFHFIKNADILATTPLRRDALEILEAGYYSVDTTRIIREEVEMGGNDICIRGKNICLSDYERIFFIGVGKCAVDASAAFEELLGARITDGIVLDVKSGVFTKLRSYIGTHPFPSEQNVSVTKEIVKMLAGVTERDLVLIVVSGGGSSLLCLPHEMECATIAAITQALWSKGASINEVNTVRKHISDIQGGQLAKLAYPATVVAFIFSDVPGNDIGMVASGPTVRDETTVFDAERILAAYDVLTMCKLPNCQLVETPKEEHYFANVTNILLATNERALTAMAKKGEALGYHCEIRDTALDGIARRRGAEFALLDIPPRTAFFWGGETTVEVSGDGMGGRNQEMALAALATIPEERVFIAAASDGWDNTDVAGALADTIMRNTALAKGLSAESFLARNDAYHFWKSIGGAIVTGRTGINVADFVILLRE